MIDREQIRQQLVAVGLDRIANDIAQLARACIRLETTPSSDDELAVGVSKFGGLPDVPADFAWPQWNEQPLAFLGQIDLATIANFPSVAPLPSHGLLSFFYDSEQSTWGDRPDDQGSWRVYLFPAQTLGRSAPSIALPAYANYRPCGVSFAEGVTFPSWGSRYMQAYQLSEEEYEKYQAFKASGETEGYGHQLLGHPREVQGEMQLECHLASNGVNCGPPEAYRSPRACELEAGAAQWRLLFQCDSDDQAGWTWGDVGLLYFWMTESDLEARQFEKVWMILQSF